MDQSPITGPTGAQFDHNVDRYPALEDIFAKVLERLDVPELTVERVEVTALASGEATYRVWPAREEDPETGYISPEEF